MVAQLHFLSQTRLIDSDGISDGASIYFYLTGTTTPAATYTTSALSTQHPHPITVAAGAAVPTIYMDSSVTYRRKIVYSDGTIDDTDPYIAPSSAGFTFQLDDDDTVIRTVEDKLSESVSVLDWIPTAYHAAIKDMSTTQDVTAYIQNALDAIAPNGVLHFPAGKYLHTGLTISNLVSLVGDGMCSTFLYTSTNAVNIDIVRTGPGGSMLNSGIFNMTLQGDANAAKTAQHGLRIDACSTGYLISYVRSLDHGGDGFRITAGCVGPMFDHIVARTNKGYGIKFLTLAEYNPFNDFAATSARLMFFVCSENAAGGIHINGGGGSNQDHVFHYFQYGLLESNGSTTAGTSGLKISGGAQGMSFRDIWIEDNNDFGIFCEADTGQVPALCQFENIYIATHDNYAIRVDAGQSFTWKNCYAYDIGLEAYFADLSNADNHMIFGNFPDITATVGGTGRNLKFISGEVGEAYWRITPSIRTTDIYSGANKVLGARQTGWTAGTGTATRTTFDTATVTTELLAQRVKALLDDLIAHGMIGA